MKSMTDELVETFADVWDALAETPEEAARLKMCSDMMIAIQETVTAWHITQAAAARRLGISQPRLNDLLRGRMGRFSLEALVELGLRAGLAVRLDIGRKAA